MRKRRKPIATVTWYEETGRGVTLPFYDHESLEEYAEGLRKGNMVYVTCIMSTSHELPVRSARTYDMAV